MILILSQNSDNSTNDVIRWLIHYNVSYKRINYKDKSVVINFNINNNYDSCELQIADNKISLNEVSFFWYRRGSIDIDNFQFESRVLHQGLVKGLCSHLYNEKRKLEEAINLHLKSIPHLGSYLDNDLNKIENLKQAKKVGLNIPDTIITSKIDELNIFFSKHGTIICKPFSESTAIDFDGLRVNGLTRLMSKSEVEGLQDFFTPTLFQQAIKSYCELRVFYLDKKFYSMATFPEYNTPDELDGRNNNSSNPLKKVPFKLPLIIRRKIVALMKECDYKTGSIDMIVTDKYEYVFLEVNPIGQFGMTSYPCNYYLEKKIANYLIKNGRKI